MHGGQQPNTHVWASMIKNRSLFLGTKVQAFCTMAQRRRLGTTISQLDTHIHTVATL